MRDRRSRRGSARSIVARVRSVIGFRVTATLAELKPREAAALTVE